MSLSSCAIYESPFSDDECVIFDLDFNILSILGKGEFAVINDRRRYGNLHRLRFASAKNSAHVFQHRISKMIEGLKMNKRKVHKLCTLIFFIGFRK